MPRLPNLADLAGVRPDAARPVGGADVSGYERGVGAGLSRFASGVEGGISRYARGVEGGLSEVERGTERFSRAGQAIERGVEKFGEGVSTAGQGAVAYQLDKGRWEYAQAHAERTTKEIELYQQLQNDTDYKTMPERYGSAIREVNSNAAGMISNPLMRTRFESDSRSAVAQFNSNIASHAKKVEGQADVAYAETKGDQLLDQAVKSPEETMRAQAIDSHNQLIDGLVAKSVITPDAGVKAKKTWAERYAIATALASADSGNESQVERVVSELHNPPANSIFAQLPVDKREMVAERVRHLQQGRVLDSLRAEQREVRQRKLQSDQMAEEYFNDAVSDNPKFGTKDILNDQRLDPHTRVQTIDMIGRSLKGEPLAAVSHRNSMDLFNRIYLPDNDPKKLTDISEINSAYSKGDLSRADRDDLRKELTEKVRDPAGNPLGARKAAFLKGAEHLIDDPILRDMDPQGAMRMYEFKYVIDQKIDEYRKAGKNPFDLFDPSKPDYMGKPAALQQYQSPLQEKFRKTLPAKPTAPASSGNSAQAAPAPVRVKTKEEADKLSPGTRYIRPDGKEFVR